MNDLLDQTLSALAHPTRRAILERLMDGETRVTDLAAPFAMSLNAVSKHIKVLEQAGLVRRRREWREHLVSFDPEPLATVADWVEKRRRFWTGQLDALDSVLSADPAPDDPERSNAMTNTATVSIQVSRRFAASAERVFDAWLDPDLARRFLFATPDGEIVRTEIDPRVGGRFSIVERRDGEDVEHTGEYVEIDRPHRLVFTFGVPRYSEATTVITVEITPRDDGCELTLTDAAVPVDRVDGNRDAWTSILDGLGRVLDGS